MSEPTTTSAATAAERNTVLLDNGLVQATGYGEIPPDSVASIQRGARKAFGGSVDVWTTSDRTTLFASSGPIDRNGLTTWISAYLAGM